MELPKFGKADGMLDGLKSKLGFQAPDNRGYDDAYYDEYGEEYGDEYADYGDYGDYGEYADDYAEPAAPARPSRTAPSASRASTRRSGSSSSMTNLVSIDDVRAHTQVPESLNRDPLPSRRVTTAASSRGGRTMVDSSLPFSMTPEGTAAVSAAASNPRRSRSEGLDSLFTPTDGGVQPSASAPSSRLASDPASRSSAIASAVPAVGTAQTSTAYDPYEAYAGAGAQSYRASRSVTVLKPASYGEVERIAKVLKGGDAVVLALRNTPDPLSKRILDFSFGVSAALDASVECIGDKVFSITVATPLTDAERMSLRGQGVL